jgi:hypothetical protein
MRCSFTGSVSPLARPSENSVSACSGWRRSWLAAASRRVLAWLATSSCPFLRASSAVASLMRLCRSRWLSASARAAWLKPCCRWRTSDVPSMATLASSPAPRRSTALPSARIGSLMRRAAHQPARPTPSRLMASTSPTLSHTERRAPCTAARLMSTITLPLWRPSSLTMGTTTCRPSPRARSMVSELATISPSSVQICTCCTCGWKVPDCAVRCSARRSMRASGACATVATCSATVCALARISSVRLPRCWRVSTAMATSVASVAGTSASRISCWAKVRRARPRRTRKFQFMRASVASDASDASGSRKPGGGARCRTGKTGKTSRRLLAIDM